MLTMKVLESLCLQVAGLLLFCLLCEAASGGCSRYGHACWGGHGKRSSHVPLPLRGTLAREDGVLETDDGIGSDSAVDLASQDADDTGQAVDSSRGRAFPDGGFGMRGAADLIPMDSEPVLQDPEPEEINEEVHRIRGGSFNKPKIQHRTKDGEDNVQVLIIPGEPQLSNLHIYKILGQSPRTRG